MKTNKLSYSNLWKTTRNYAYVCVCVCVCVCGVQGERFSINGLTRGWNGGNAKRSRKVIGEEKFEG